MNFSENYYLLWSSSLIIAKNNEKKEWKKNGNEGKEKHVFLLQSSVRLSYSPRGATTNFRQGNSCGALPQYILIINIDSNRIFLFYDLNEIKQKLGKVISYALCDNIRYQ